jgi:ABC-type nitrate/sulfonate/bicarbonate transport system permease component
MYVGLFVIALIGFGVSFLLREIERWVIPWKTDN